MDIKLIKQIINNNLQKCVFLVTNI